MTLTEATDIRPLRDDDAEAIEALYDACMAVEPSIGPVTAAQWRAFLRLPQFHGGRDFLVAERAGAVVALAESSLRQNDDALSRTVKILVRPDMRRMGLGSRILGRVLAQAPDDVALDIHVTIRPDWSAAQSFLAHFGFVEIEREIGMRADTIAMPAGVVPGLLIERAVDGKTLRAALAELHGAAYAGSVGVAPLVADDIGAWFDTFAVWVARLDGVLAGFALVEQDGDLCWLESLAVAPARQGRGIGARLAAAALEAERSATTRRFGLSVSSHNAGARALYGRLGFRTTSERIRLTASRAMLIEHGIGRGETV